jgi:hypothetical protein
MMDATENGVDPFAGFKWHVTAYVFGNQSLIISNQIPHGFNTVALFRLIRAWVNLLVVTEV